jgi:hypothetical protein
MNTRTMVALTLVAGMWITPELSDAADKHPDRQKYHAIAMSVSGGRAGGATRVDFWIDRWTTDDERVALLTVLADKGSEELVKALQDQKAVGRIRSPEGLGYDLRYARENIQGDTRTLVLATDRPVSMGEVVHSRRSLDYGVTLLVVTLGPDGEGSGKMVVGAKLVLADNELSIESASIQPVQLTEVRRTD